MTGRKTVTTTHGRYTVDGSMSEKTIKLMAMPYEQTLTIHDAETGRLIGDEEAVETPQRGDNILITDFDRHYTMGDEFVAVVRVRERHGYMPTDGGYSETVVVQGNREALREAVRRALDYARDRGIRRVCVNNRQVREDIEAGVIDTTDLEVVYGGGALR